MSQDYHITRAPDWMVTRGSEISDREWQDYAHNDVELRSDPENGPNAFVWLAHPATSTDAWLDWSQGNIYAVDPDEALTSKMLQVAKTLGARVVDDSNQAIAQEVERS